MELSIQTQERTLEGTRNNQKLRRAQFVPAVLYGGGQPPQKLSIEHKQLAKASENEIFYSQVINLHLNGKTEKAVLKELQRHPFRALLIHADFLRISEDVKITMRVPIHYINTETCRGVKQQGGAFTYDMSEIDITCLPKDLPAFIEVDVGDMNLHDVLHISDMKLPEGVEAVSLLQDKEGGHQHDLPIVRVIQPRLSAEEDLEVEEGTTEEEATEDAEKEQDKKESESG